MSVSVRALAVLIPDAKVVLRVRVAPFGCLTKPLELHPRIWNRYTSTFANPCDNCPLSTIVSLL